MDRKQGVYLMILKMLWVFLFIMPIYVLAKGGGDIPLRFVFFQIFNFSLFAVALLYLIRKHLPSFLQRKQDDFLEYRRRARELEKQHEQDCISLEEEVRVLIKKEKNIKESVANILNNLRQELEAQEKQWLENMEMQADKEIKLQRFTELNRLKNRFLSQVMQQTKKKLKKAQAEEPVHKLSQVIRQWGDM